MKPINFQLSILLCLGSFLLAAPHSLAVTATWKQNPSSSDWNTARNWMPRAVPNGSSDIATFFTTNQPFVQLSAPVEVSQTNFMVGANTFTISMPAFTTLTLSGPGVMNLSGVTQQFALSGNDNGFVGGMLFANSANAGTLTSYDLEGGRVEGITGTYVEFFNSSTAGSASFVLNGPTVDGGNGASIFFGDDASADHATIVNQGAALEGAFGGQVAFAGRANAAFARIVNNGASGNSPVGGALIFFQENSSAGQATITMNAATNPAGGGSQAYFEGSASAGNATLIAEDGTPMGAPGGVIFFLGDSTGGNGRLEVFGNGILDLSSHNPAFMTFGSIEGSGTAFISEMFFEVGFNNLSTTFSGIIQDGGSGGTLFKEGTGTLTLTGPNSYTGGTAIDDGALIVRNRGASPTGTGDVSVNQGTLGGESRLLGAIVVGTGGGTGAFLAPGVNGIGMLATTKTLRFGGNSTYLCELDPKRRRSDSVAARGVTILSDSTFSLIGLRQRRLPVGTTFVVVNNTSANAISGTFSNLADQSTVTAGGNTFQANYQGGDGNDLTLTVVP
jgi:autotransporter-associated beta strand protein